MICSESRDLDRVNEALEQFASTHRIAGRAVLDLRVALDEVLSNIFKYAWSDRRPHNVRVRLGVRGEALEVEVVDDGAPFNPLAHAAPPGDRVRVPGGLGLRLLRQLVDEIRYRRARNRNHVTLVKHDAIRAVRKRTSSCPPTP